MRHCHSESEADDIGLQSLFSAFRSVHLFAANVAVAVDVYVFPTISRCCRCRCFCSSWRCSVCKEIRSSVQRAAHVNNKFQQQENKTLKVKTDEIEREEIKTISVFKYLWQVLTVTVNLAQFGAHYTILTVRERPILIPNQSENTTWPSPKKRRNRKQEQMKI